MLQKKAHEQNKYHSNCKIKFQSLSTIVSGQVSSVYDQLNIVANKGKQDNYKIISPVIQSVILCGC